MTDIGGCLAHLHGRHLPDLESLSVWPVQMESELHAMASGYLLTAVLSEIRIGKPHSGAADLVNGGHHVVILELVQQVETVCITDTRRFMAGL